MNKASRIVDTNLRNRFIEDFNEYPPGVLRNQHVEYLGQNMYMVFCEYTFKESPWKFEYGTATYEVDERVGGIICLDALTWMEESKFFERYYTTVPWFGRNQI